MPQETGAYGHPVRRHVLAALGRGGHPKARYVLVTNADNYYAPPFLEKMAGALDAHPQAIAAYCSRMVHSYPSTQLLTDVPMNAPSAQNLAWGVHPWGVRNVLLERGHIDCGGVLVRRQAAATVSWPSDEHSSDWTYFERILARFGGAGRWRKVDGCLFVHN